MRKISSKKLQSIVHRVLIPLAVVSSSVTVLSVSYWYHEKRLTAQLNAQAPIGTGTLSTQLESQRSTKNTTMTTPTKTSDVISKNTTNTANKSVSSSVTTNGVHTNQTSSKPALDTKRVKHATTDTSTASSKNSSTSAKESSNAASQAPAKTSSTSISTVQGGSAKLLANQQMTNTTVESAVLQFGNEPQTTGMAGGLTSSWGTSLVVPKSIDSSRLLAVSLQKGILWAIITPTDIQPDGQLGSASRPTDLMYTPYPKKNSASLTDGSILVGEIPVITSSSKELGTNWTHVEQAQVNTSQKQSDYQSANGQVSANTSNGTNHETGNTTNNSTVVPVNDSTTGTHVYLSALYQDDFGGVIVLTMSNATGPDGKIVYTFDEDTHAIQKVTTLPNDGTTYSWLAVATNHLYWGIRRVDATNPSAFQTKQYTFNLQTGTTHTISLGTWTDAVYVNGDHLIFQVKNTTAWKVFVPSTSHRTTLATGNSTGS